MTGRVVSLSICAWGKVYTLNRDKYMGLWLIEQAMKVLEHEEKVSFSKEMRLMRCIVASADVVTLQMQFAL